MTNSRIVGTGIDIVENRRMHEVLERWGARFRDRVFLAREQEYCQGKASPWRHYAGRFAVKEAVSKAFGTGVGPHLNWLDVEVRTDPESGAPSVAMSGGAEQMARARGVSEVFISLSHTRDYAVAHALLVGEDTP